MKNETYNMIRDCIKHSEFMIMNYEVDIEYCQEKIKDGNLDDDKIRDYNARIANDEEKIRIVKETVDVLNKALKIGGYV